jgi:hypothetical protein
MRLDLSATVNVGTAALKGLFSTISVVAIVINPAQAGTKTATFGWEDGTSTVNLDITDDGLNDLPAFVFTPDSSAINLANVSSGSQFDFQTSTTTPVAPFAGNRMLEVAVTPATQDTGTDAAAYLGIITGLTNGDTFSFKFRTHDPTENRSPSNPPNASYSNTSNITFGASGAGFPAPIQQFISTGTGWLETILDADGNQNTGANPVVTYNPAGENANAVRLHAEFFYQSASVPTQTPEKFYIDDLEITVTSDNPDARIYLPNGTSVLVNAPASLGDFNNDGKVDAGDYVTWRKEVDTGGTDALANDDGLGTPVGAAHYTLWRSNFGNPPGSGSGLGEASAIPEPASVVLLVIGLAAFCARRRRA